MASPKNKATLVAGQGNGIVRGVWGAVTYAPSKAFEGLACFFMSGPNGCREYQKNVAQVQRDEASELATNWWGSTRSAASVASGSKSLDDHWADTLPWVREYTYGPGLDAFDRQDFFTVGTELGKGEVLVASIAFGVRKLPSLRSSSSTRALSVSDQRGVASLQRRMQEHQIKLREYVADPRSFDNTGRLAGAQTAAIEELIIAGRIRTLEHDIRVFQTQIDDILGAGQ